MTTPAPTPTTTARAAPEIRRTLVRSAATTSLMVAALLVFSVFVPPIRLVAIVLAIASVAYIVFVVLYLRRALVEFGGGRYRVREVGDTRFSAAEVALAVPIDEFPLPGQTGPALVLIGTARRRLAEITAASFGTDTLESLVRDLLAHGVPIDHLTGRVTPAQFAERHPRVLSFPTRRPIALNLIVGAILAAIFAMSIAGWGPLA